MTTMARLKAAGCRIDGLSWNAAGELVFIATRASGAWSEAEKARVCRALGRPAASDSAA